MEFIFPTKDEIVEFFNTRHGFFSVIDVATIIVAPRVQRSTPMDDEWKHVRKLLHELKAEDFLLVVGEGGDIYHEKFSSTPERIERYKLQKSSQVSGDTSEISKSIKAFLADKRFPKKQRSFDEISKHYPTLTSIAMREHLMNAGAVKYRGANNTEWWGRPADNIEGIEPKSADSDDNGKVEKDHKSIHVAGDYVAGDKVGRDKLNENERNLSGNKYYWFLVIPIVVIVVGSVITDGKMPAIFNHSVISVLSAVNTATTTPNLIDIYNRAFSYDILADRQDFFRKYIDSNIYGDGTIEEISSLGDRYILEIKINGYSILCPQEKTDNFERSYPLLKGKSVRFFGVFTYRTISGYDVNALAVDQCSFERK